MVRRSATLMISLDQSDNLNPQRSTLAPKPNPKPNPTSARNDLDPDKPRPTGCIDGKVTNYHAALDGRSWAVNGPTAEQGLPPFKWGSEFEGVPHRGEPAVFDYKWQEMKP
jgi:hypothetical protein